MVNGKKVTGKKVTLIYSGFEPPDPSPVPIRESEYATGF